LHVGAVHAVAGLVDVEEPQGHLQGLRKEAFFAFAALVRRKVGWIAEFLILLPDPVFVERTVPAFVTVIVLAPVAHGFTVRVAVGTGHGGGRICRTGKGREHGADEDDPIGPSG